MSFERKGIEPGTPEGAQYLAAMAILGSKEAPSEFLASAEGLHDYAGIDGDPNIESTQVFLDAEFAKIHQRHPEVNAPLDKLRQQAQ